MFMLTELKESLARVLLLVRVERVPRHVRRNLKVKVCFQDERVVQLVAQLHPGVGNRLGCVHRVLNGRAYQGEAFHTVKSLFEALGFFYSDKHSWPPKVSSASMSTEKSGVSLKYACNAASCVSACVSVEER